MFAYYLQLGVRSLRRNLILTLLMVLGIALGIAATMTSLTVFHLMGTDPIPEKSSILHYVQVDSWDPNQAFDNEGNPPDQLTYRDASALMEAGKADKQAAMYQISFPIQPENPQLAPFQASGRATYADFFSMFDTPFRFGGAWDHDQDAKHGRVVVLSRDANEKLFGGQDSVGRHVRSNDVDYTVTGVLAQWSPRIKYYDLTQSTLDEPEEIYIPYNTAIEMKTSTSGNNNCWDDSGPGWDAYLQSECVWQQMWVQLDSPAKLAQYQAFLDNYANEQKKLGRFKRPLSNRLPSVNEWMANQKVVPQDVEMQVGLSFAFLLVCLINTVGLLLAKFMRKSGEIGLRRALGASKPQLFLQHVIESGVIGVSGGVIGLLLTTAGLWLVRSLYDSFSNVARLDWEMVATTIGLSILAAVLAGLYPTWRACQIAPAAQLKTQ
jgi:putative ABC transport system permease protein